MIKLIVQFLLLFFNNTSDNSGKVRLEKKEPKTSYATLLTRFQGIFVLTLIILLFILFIAVCFTIVGLSATESGMMRNFLNTGGY